MFLDFNFSIFTSVAKPPEQILCNLFTRKYAAHWKRIGNLLGVDDSTLENIAYETQNDEESCNSLWKVWLSNNINATWHNAYLAVDIASVTILLQDIYKEERNKDRVEIWTSSYQPEHFANVSVICYNERRATLKQVETIARVTHSGNLYTGLGSLQQSSDSYISGCKRTSCISDIFDSDISEDKRLPCLTPKVILIEGAPGIGKTILSREIAFQWACHKILCNKHLLFLVPLRDPQLSQIKSLKEFVCYVIKSTSNIKHTINYLEINSGKHCTIVFDGYDEISEDAKQNSFVGKIIKQKELPLCSLVITSRPSASVDLHRIIDRRVEILGFTKENRNEYICRNLKDNEIPKINEYLQNNPFINDLCYIPLNMTILLCLFKGYTSLKLPETQADINAQFIYITMSRFISKQKNKSITIKSPDDLQMPYKKNFSVLCRLAFDLLGNDKIVFTDDDIQKYIPKKSATNWNTLGLLREANYYSVIDNKAIRSYSYVHLSMQECLAAHYVAKEVENSFLKEYFWDSRYLNTGIMYVGLTKGKSPAFQNFFSGRSGSFSRQFGADKVTVHDKVKKLHLFHCLLEAKNDELSEQLQVDKVLYNNIIDLSDHVLQQKDIHTLSFFLSRSTIKQWEKLDLSNCRINDEGLENFSAMFLNSKVTNVSISTIDLSDNNLSSDSIDATINLISCFKVKNIVIADNVAEALEFKVALLSSVANLKVEEVSISSSGESSQFLINYKHNDMNQTFINQLQFKRHLYAWNANILLSLTHLIVKCNTINIYEENLPDEKIDDVASELKTICEERNNTVTYVLQSENNIIAYKAEFYQITQSLSSNNFSKHDSNRKTFDMRQCNIGDENFSELNKVFCQHNVEYLDKLIVSRCSLTSLCIPTLLEILKFCVIRHLKISDDLICNITLCNLILSETTVNSKIKNFKLNIPLMLSTTKASKLFFANSTFNDSVFLKDYDLVNSQLYFTNSKLNEDNIQSFLKLCRNNTQQINLLDMNMRDEIVNDVLTELKRFQDNTYLLASSRRLIAYNVKQQQIMEAVANNSDITTLQLINCEINLSKFYPLGKLLSNSLRNWKLIDFSGCNIEDEGCLNLYECFTANKNKNVIEELNLSSNCLSSQSIIAILKFFEFCIIKTLIISKNDIPVYTFDKELFMYLLAEKLILNFRHKIPLLMCENQSPHEICNVYTFQESDIGVFLSHSHEDSTLYNLYQVQFDQKYYFDHTFSILLTNSTVLVYLLVEGAMTEKIRDMIAKLTKFKCELSKVDYSRVSITDESCKILCNSIFNDRSSLKLIEEVDFSSKQFSLTCAPVIIESLQYCVIKHLVLPNIAVLDKISETIIKDFHAGKSIINFTERIPLTINIETEVEDEEDGITYNIIANTYLQNYKIKEELFNHYNDLVINHLTTSHTFVLLDCLKANTLNSILSILYTKASYIKICIFEIRLTDDILEASVNHLKTLKKEIYRDRLRYVLASNSKIVAYNAKHFQILQALQIKPKICNLEITHCIISNDQLISIALTLIGTFNLLKNIKVSACRIKDKDFSDFCDILSGFPKALACLKTIDFSHNHLTSSCIGTILRLLQCFIIEKLIVSNNSINDSALTDAIFQLARYKWTKVCNLHSSIPLVIINAPNVRHCKPVRDRGRHVTIFHMNCEIDENLLTEYCNKAKNIYCLNSLVAIGDLRTNLSKLYHPLPNSVKVFVYEKDLKDEIAQKAATCLKKEAQINFILTSQTKILANRSSYHQIAPLLDSNTLINTLQITNINMQFPSDCRFVRAFRNTSRNWEMIDLSGCNIHDNGCVELQECFVIPKSTIKHLNLMYNNLSSVSAVAIAIIILNCNVKTVNISSNKLQSIHVNNVLSCLKQNSANAVSVEIISNNSTTVVLSNTDPKLLPYQSWSSRSNCKIQLSIMKYFQFDYIDCILSSFHNPSLSLVILQNNGLTLEQIEAIIKKLPRTNLCIEEAHMQYNSKFIDCTFESLMNNLLNATKDDSPLSSFSSLLFSEVDMKNNKICIYDNKIICNSVKDTLTRFIHWQRSTTLVAVKLSNFYVTNNIATELASVINKIADLKLFELSYNYIQESDLKVIIRALQSTKSLLFFSIKSIDCFIEDTAEDIASTIARNNAIKYLEISNCDMKQSGIIKIAKSIKKLRELKQLNLSNIALTCEELEFVLEDKGRLEELNLSHCKLLNPEIVKISLALNNARLKTINFNYNNISDCAANALTSLLFNRSLSRVEMSNCNLQEEGMSSIINALKYKSLKYLDFSGNRVTDLLATNISAGIANNPYITNLDLSNCSLQEFGIVEILTSLKEHASHLKCFKVNSLPSNGEIVSLFECVLKNNRSIENLTLQDCECVEIFNALRKKLSSLQTLDISLSKISFQNLMHIVANNINLKHLNFSNCDLQGELNEIIEISGLFLEYVNLSGNRITKTFANFIANLIYTNYKLKHVDIANCEIQETELICITNSLTLLTSLKCLNCSNNVISQQVASNIAKIITNNVNLEHLDISLCYLTEETFTPIVNALKQIQTMKYLNMSFNYITFDCTSITLSKKLADSFTGKAVENGNMDDYDTISIAGNELIPLSKERSGNADQYNSISQAPNEAKFPCNSNINDYDTVSDSFTDKTVENGNMDDYDTISIAGNELIPLSKERSGNADQYNSISQAPGEAKFPCDSNINDYDTVSVALGEITPLCSSSIYEDPILPTTDETSNSYDDKSENSDDYDTHSLTPDVITSQRYSNIYENTILQTTEETPLSYNPRSAKADDFDNIYLVLHDEISTFNVFKRISPSNSIKDTDACDYDTISMAGEITLQHSQTSENVSTNISDIPAACKLTKSYSSESLLPDYGYETVPMNDDMTSGNSNETLGDDYENLPTIDKITMRYSCDQNSLIGSYELENDSVDNYEDIFSTNDKPIPKYPSNKILENSPTYCYEKSSLTNVSEAISKITEVVTCNCFLECLDISDCKLSDLQIAAVVLALSKTSTLKDLNLSYNIITTDDTARKIASVIVNNLSLKKINLSNCNLQESGIIIIAEALANITSLISIDMSENSITDNNMQSVAAFIGENLLLEELNLGHCYQYNTDLSFTRSKKGVKDILMTLTMLTSLKYLDLHSSYINEIASELLPVVIANNKSLSHLDLTDCKLPYMKLIAIAKKLQSTYTLKFLSLSSNVIVNDAAYEIALAVSNNFVLEYLALSDCELEERGFRDITESLLNISSLKHLDLSNNVITDRVAETLVFGIANNMKLTYLDLSSCTWQDIGFARIQEVVYKLPMIKEFDIRSL